MENFRQMTNDCIRIGLEFERQNNEGRTPSMKKLSLLAYKELRARHGGYSGITLCAISKAAGILAARRKSMRRGFRTKDPYVSRPVLVSCYGFKMTDGFLLIPVGERQFEKISLNAHTLEALSQKPRVTVRSFTLTGDSLSLCVAKQTDKQGHEIEVNGFVGVDRNLRNITVGDEERVIHYDISKAVEIAHNTRSIVGSFKRNDVRIRKKIFEKYGKRRKERVNQILHRVSKDIVSRASENRQAIVFEDIKDIRNLYRKGNGQGREYRGRMNSAPWGELKRQVEYKAAWEDGKVPVITLTKSETRGTTMDCPRCGERLQVASREDEEHYRQLWCQKCERWTDRDVVAVMNISRRGRLRFDRSQGEAVEAVKGNPLKEWSSQQEEPVILRVDASKLGTNGFAEMLVQRT